MREALARAGVDADAVLAEVEPGGRPRWSGTSTSVCVERARRVRGADLHRRRERGLRPADEPARGDGQLARDTIDGVLDLIDDHPELNEFKHTRLAV